MKSRARSAHTTSGVGVLRKDAGTIEESCVGRDWFFSNPANVGWINNGDLLVKSRVRSAHTTSGVGVLRKDAGTIEESCVDRDWFFSNPANVGWISNGDLPVKSRARIAYEETYREVMEDLPYGIYNLHPPAPTPASGTQAEPLARKH